MSVADAGAPRSLSDASCKLDGGAATYQRGVRRSACGEKLASYAWSGTSTPRARVLLVHGFRSHTRYNFLSNVPGLIHAYGGDDVPGAPSESFVRLLVRAGFSVHAHDHVGHGESEGLRAYFDGFDVLVKDVLSHAAALGRGEGSAEEPWDVEDRTAVPGESIPDLPLFVFGHSMGGAVAVLGGMEKRGVFAGMMLSSAATEAPAQYGGMFGPVWYALAVAASSAFPRVELLPMAKNTRLPEMQALYESDRLNLLNAVRGRVGYEFMCAYDRITKELVKVDSPFLTMSGGHDTLVNPEASRRFYEGAVSVDKTLNVREENWHNLLTEPGKEENWDLYLNWLIERAPVP